MSADCGKCGMDLVYVDGDLTCWSCDVQDKRIADLERQLKEAKDDKDKCQEYGMSLQQQLQEVNERIVDYQLSVKAERDIALKYKSELAQLKDVGKRKDALYQEMIDKSAQLRQERDRFQKEYLEVVDALGTHKDAPCIEHWAVVQDIKSIVESRNDLKESRDEIYEFIKKLSHFIMTEFPMETHEGDCVSDSIRFFNLLKDERDTLRAEVERLKRVNDEYGVEEVGKLVDRVQELEGAMQSVLAESIERYQCSRCEYIEQIAKHALDGGKE